jgi:hypothetical protein
VTGSCVLVGCRLVVLVLRVLVYLEARGGWRRRGLEGVALGRLGVHFRGGCTLRGGTLRGVAAGAGTLRGVAGAVVGAAVGGGTLRGVAGAAVGAAVGAGKVTFLWAGVLAFVRAAVGAVEMGTGGSASGLGCT